MFEFSLLLASRLLLKEKKSKANHALKRGSGNDWAKESGQRAGTEGDGGEVTDVIKRKENSVEDS